MSDAVIQDTSDNRKQTSGLGVARLRELMDEFESLQEHVFRTFLLELHARELITAADLRPQPQDSLRDNRPSESRWSRRTRDSLRRRVFGLVAESFDEETVRKLIEQVQRRESSHCLEDLAERPDSSLSQIRRALSEVVSLVDQRVLTQQQRIATRVSLLRRFFSDDLHYLRVAREQISLSRLQPQFERMIHSRTVGGRVGGKAAGQLLAAAIIDHELEEARPALKERVTTPPSWFLTADVNEDFVNYNRLQDFRAYKYKPIHELRHQLPVVTQIFCNSNFPPHVQAQLERMLIEIGPEPIIVRSSSLLEDSFGGAFSGMYKSIFLGNQGALVDRLEALCSAIAEVYASMLGPDPIAYRSAHRLLEYDESMGIMVQRVVGHKHGRWFFPLMAGVGFSVNDFLWTDKLKREDGVLRLVLGLGSRAVDRMPDDYPRLVGLSDPRLRPESTVAQIRRYSQHHVDLIDLERDCFDTVPLAQLLSSPAPEGLELALSVDEGGYLRDWKRGDGLPTAERACLTFNALCHSDRLLPLLKRVLAKLQQAYGCPVDLEFAWDQGCLHLLQCRPLARYAEGIKVQLPEEVPQDKLLFETRGRFPMAWLRNIDWLIWLDDRAWEKASSSEREGLRQIVARLNDMLADDCFVLAGPGRWGSSNPDLGVPVAYNDICHAAALIEIAREEDDYAPEVSYGTHFYQDLVEDGIYCVPLRLQQEEVVLQERLLLRAKNSLPDLLSDVGRLAHFLRVVDVRSLNRGPLQLALDAESSRGLCWWG